MFESSAYDGSVNMFNPDGRIKQVEYAMAAVNSGSTILGIKTKDAVVIAVEKPLLSSLIIPTSIHKIHQIDNHLCAASCGVVSDARALIDKARVESQNYRFTFDQIIPTKSIARTIGDTILNFGKGDDMPSRPFGVKILLAGADETKEAKLYCCDPGGSYDEWKTKAVGAGEETAQGELEEAFDENMSLETGKKTVLKVLEKVIKEGLDKDRVEVAVVQYDTVEENRFTILPPEELQALIDQVKAES
eukprot:augustus_masked-scaffold_9-processed-gene-4.57-mRNA-1 protein AED:0.01 eAED:0.01 QI:0/-1/0/1/-1/1/1/0/246